jgi:transposase-like protein
MAKRRYTAEEIVAVLRQVEVAVANGKSTPQACPEAGITEQTYYRWRKEYGRLKLEQAKRLKELEKENSRLKRLVAELSLEKQIHALRLRGVGIIYQVAQSLGDDRPAQAPAVFQPAASLYRARLLLARPRDGLSQAGPHTPGRLRSYG